MNIVSVDLVDIVDLVRTRDESILATCTIVVDVGAKYEPHNQRYDHHQRGFTEVFGHGFTTKLSSAGLVYKWVVQYSPLCLLNFVTGILEKRLLQIF